MGAGLGERGRGGQPGAEVKRGLVSALWAPTQRPLCLGNKAKDAGSKECSVMV